MLSMAVSWYLRCREPTTSCVPSQCRSSRCPSPDLRGEDIPRHRVASVLSANASSANPLNRPAAHQNTEGQPIGLRVSGRFDVRSRRPLVGALGEAHGTAFPLALPFLPAESDI